MKLDPKNCKPGAEQHRPYQWRGRDFVQYDYRAPDGELFSCVAPTLEASRERRDKWTTNRGQPQEREDGKCRIQTIAQH